MRRAFSLVELLVTTAIVAIILVLALPNFFGGSQGADLNAITEQIVASAREAESQSADQALGIEWGIHFDNTNSSPPYVAVFTGTSYASGTIESKYSLPPNIGYMTASIPLGSSTDVIFSPISGNPPTSTTIRLYVLAEPSLSSTIEINSFGVVSYAIPPSSSGSSRSCNGTIGNWSSTKALPSPLDRYSGFANNGYVYVAGGVDPDDGTPSSIVLYAAINSNGTLGNWTMTKSLPSQNFAGVGLANNGYGYIVGGGDYSGTPTSTVLYALINNSDGTISNWSSTTPLPIPLDSQLGFVNNGYAYVAGGYTVYTPTSTVFYAHINSNGMLGNWSSTTPLPSPLDRHVGFINNGYAYIIGGADILGTPTSTVLYAAINSNGTIGHWAPTTPLPNINFGGVSFVTNGYAYLAGGANASTPTSTILYALINNNGTIGNWSSTTPLPSALDSQLGFVSNGYAYIAGGYVVFGATSTVFYVPFICQ